MSKNIIEVAQPIQKKILLLLILKELLGHGNQYSNKISSFKHGPLFFIAKFPDR